MRIVSIDPGGTSGWAAWQEGVLDYGHLEGDHHKKLFDFLCAQTHCLHKNEWADRNMVIVCERFDHVSGVAKLDSVEYIGVIKFFQQTYSVQLVLQSRSIKPGQDKKKGWASDDKLQACSMLIRPKTKWVHANDAMRHLMYFGFHNNKAPPELRQEILKGLKALTKES